MYNRDPNEVLQMQNKFFVHAINADAVVHSIHVLSNDMRMY